MARNGQVQRQWRLWLLLTACQRPMACTELAAALAPEAVTPRTVRRDLEVLRSIGVPILSRRDGRDLRYAARGDGPELRLDRDALLALRLALGLLRPFDGTPVGESLAQLTTRLEALLPARVLAHFSSLAGSVVVRQDSPPNLRASEAAFERVREALSSGRVVLLDYCTADGRKTQRRVHSQALVYGPRGLYLIGHDEARNGELRTFRLERVLAARVTGQPARKEPTFDPDVYLSGSLGIHSPEHPPRTFRIALHTEQAVQALRENPWHPGQKIVHRKDSGWQLCLELTSSRELIPRMLGLGPEVELLEPRDVREEIGNLVRQAAERYAPSNTKKRRGSRS